LESVHLDFYPKAKDLTQDQKDTLEQMQLTRDIVSTSLSIRVENNMKVRQPLGNLYIKSKKDEVLEFYADLVSDEVNVKNVTSITEPLENTKQSESSAFIAYLDTNITEELKLEGLAREMVRKLQDIRKEQGLNVSDAVNATYEATEENTKAVAMFGEYIKQKVLAKQLKEDSVFTITKL
jgi:isoleucyl-tRNA synthetase